MEYDYLQSDDHGDDHDVDNEQEEVEEEELLLNFKGASKELEINNIILYDHNSNMMVKIKSK